MTSTTNYWDNIERVKNFMNTADAVLVGIGAGMSTAAGFTYSGERFHKYFDDFHKNMALQICILADFIPLKVWKSIGRGGAVTFIIIAMIPLLESLMYS
uniref:hypothetical protein n=1 Tax=uncultured Veillonella sp. TaxID=159268 RepID=UPI0025F2A2E9|nr:hypothetical protein [uncultured Veillonella sp.]